MLFRKEIIQVNAMIKDLIHEVEEESSKEKHVPHIEVSGDLIKVSCGKDIMHPSTNDHHIAWIKLYGIDKDGKFRELGSANPTPALADPVVCFKVDAMNFKELHALEYCNIHGIWQNKLVL